MYAYKSKKPLIITLVIVIILIVVLAALVALYFTTDFLKSNEQLFAKYLFQKDNTTQTLTTDDIYEVQKQFKETNSYTAEGNLQVSMQDGNGKNEEVNITTNTKHDAGTNRTLTEAIVKEGEADLVKFSYLNSEDVYAILCENVYQNYVGIRNGDLKQLAKNLGADEASIEQIPDSISFENINTTEYITDEEINYILDTYGTVLKESINGSQYAKVPSSNITINAQNYTATGYSLTITPENVQTIITNILTKIQEDANTMTILQNVLARLGLDVQEQFTEENIRNALNQLLDNIQKENVVDFNTTITVYVANAKAIRTVISIEQDTISNIIIDSVTTANGGTKYIFTITEDITDFTNVSTAIQTGELNGIQVEIEKTVSNSGTSHNENLMLQEDGNLYSISSQTLLGNVQDNSIYNTSSVTIEDSNNNTVTISYDKTLNATTEPMDIMELKNSNAVIINNYPLEQLEPFFEDLGEKYGQLFTAIAQRLKLDTESSDATIKYTEEIIGGILTVANTNGFQITNALTAMPSILPIALGAGIYSSASSAITNVN